MYGHSYVFIYQSDFPFEARPVPAASQLPDVLEHYVHPDVIEELPAPHAALPSSVATQPGDVLAPLAFVPPQVVEEPPAPWTALGRGFGALSIQVLDPLGFLVPPLPDELPVIGRVSEAPRGANPTDDDLRFVVPPLSDELPAGVGRFERGAGPALEELDFVFPPILDDGLPWSGRVVTVTAAPPAPFEELAWQPIPIAAELAASAEPPATYRTDGAEPLHDLAFIPPPVIDIPMFTGYPPATPAVVQWPEAEMDLAFFAPLIPDELGAGVAPALTFTNYGGPWRYVAERWPGWSFRLETYFAASAGTVHARLWNLTAGIPVIGSGVATAAPAFTRTEGGDVLLTDGHEYVAQFAKGAGSDGETYNAFVLATKP